MKITTITRTYNRSVSINTLRSPDKFNKNDEQWFKFEAMYTAELESMDDPKLVSDKLIEMAKSDVAQSIKTLKEQINPQQ